MLQARQATSGAQHLHFGTSMPSGGVHPIKNSRALFPFGLQRTRLRVLDPTRKSGRDVCCNAQGIMVLSTSLGRQSEVDP